MLETICVRDNFKILVTVLAILVTNIFYLLLLVSGTNTQKIIKSHQDLNSVANILELSPAGGPFSVQRS